MSNEIGGVVETTNGLEEQLGRIGNAEQTPDLIGEEPRCGKGIGGAGFRLGAHVRRQETHYAVQKGIPANGSVRRSRISCQGRLSGCGPPMAF